jgi:hypothetical protein
MADGSQDSEPVRDQPDTLASPPDNNVGQTAQNIQLAQALSNINQTMTAMADMLAQVNDNMPKNSGGSQFTKLCN